MSFVRIFEVGPRDGLQNETRLVSTEVKLQWMEGLISAGIRDLEVGAFVRQDRVPQMRDSEDVFQYFSKSKRIIKSRQLRIWGLVPNLKGLDRAQAVGVKNVAVFTAVSETFNQKNIGMSVGESLRQIEQMVQGAKKKKLRVRGYISTVFGCPFEGKIKPVSALRVMESLIRLGVDEISVGDTIGVADPVSVERILKPALQKWDAKKIAVHFHDTRGTALANTLRALDLGIRIVDSSAGGLGGCPFAPGATGNLATEDLVYMLHQMGVKTGVNLEKLCQTNLRFFQQIGRQLGSRYMQAYLSQCLQEARRK